MAQGASCSIWLSYGLVLVLLILCTITVMITPTESSSAIPLIRQRTDANTTNGNESSLSDADVQKRIQEVFNRKGYSNPDPSPNDSLEAQPEEVAVRIDSAAPTRRRKRPLWKLDEKFDPRKSYVIKHPNGTITYVPPKDIDLSGTVDTGTTAAPANSNANELIDKMSEATPKIDRIESTLEYPIGSNVKNYPYELIDRLVAQQGYANLFDSYPEDEEVDDFTFHNRMSFSDDDFEDICESQKPDKYPQHGLTMDNKNVTIVNTKNFTQRVEMEVCRKQGTPCVMCDNQFKKTECRQIFLELTLHAFDKSKNQIYKEKVMIPASCKCMVVRFKGF
ncbi:uncharacterized protein LOC5577953 isoform X4 [Aedes aegypti]|uniref:Uncharacterized protein n=1 Tax=Aedes aegypti TaxID=7159 RepID=A0A6I8TFH1_AEDAE|nr:uncharacterized protein LOC5577953 isoform X4 [Aedes aegypti]